MSARPPAAAPRRCQRAFHQAVQLSQQLLTVADRNDECLSRRRESVSAWSVAEHLEHLAQVNTLCAAAISRLLDSPPGDPGAGLKPAGRAVLLTGWIPRGRGVAPPTTVPSAAPLSEIRSRLRDAHVAVNAIGERLNEVDGARARLSHPLLGGFTAFQWLRFIAIHTRHHLKIIEEIERSAS